MRVVYTYMYVRLSISVCVRGIGSVFKCMYIDKCALLYQKDS